MTSTVVEAQTRVRPLSFTARGDDERSAAYPRRPLQSSGALKEDVHARISPVLGEKFSDSFDLREIWDLKDTTQRDAILRDLAILVARRGVVIIKRQDNFPPELLGELVHKLGQLSGKPATSHLHIHPLNGDFNEDGSRKGGEKITTERDAQGRQVSFADERSSFASQGWHTDVSFEVVPADFTILRMNEVPEYGGDTMFASSYEACDRLSPVMKAFLEGLTATHDAEVFRAQAARYGFKLRTLARGCPEDVGDAMKASHPVVRTHPVTGWKTLFVNQTFTSRINELSKDESDLLLGHLFRLTSQNHDLQIRYSWEKNDIAIWDNRSVQHSATFDLDAGVKRSGDRAVSLAERPYFDPKSISRRDAISNGEKA